MFQDAGAQLGDVVGDAPIERQHQAERELRDRNRVLARTVGDVDAARGGAGDVDGVVAGAGADDEREPAGVEHRRGHLGAAHDQHVRAARRDRLRQRVFFELRLVDHLAAGGLQSVDAALLEFVGD